MVSEVYKSALVTIVMPVFNGESHLASAIESVLEQDFQNWKLLIVDDCSTDKSLDIIGGYRDSRISTIGMETNSGIAVALNVGVQMADTPFIARLDQDDLAMPSRLSTQLDFFESHPQIALIGTWAEFFSGGSRVVRPPTEHRDLLADLLWRNPFVHSSVMFRRSILEKESGPYNPAFTGCEDYELWQRISVNFGVAIVPEVLVRHRLHRGQMTAGSQAKRKELTLRKEIARRHRVDMGFEPGRGLRPPSFLLANIGFLLGKQKATKISQVDVLAAFSRWISRQLRSFWL